MGAEYSRDIADFKEERKLIAYLYSRSLIKRAEMEEYNSITSREEGIEYLTDIIQAK